MIEITAQSAPPYNLKHIARLALAMYDHGAFFSIHRNLEITFSNDYNGGGNQYVHIQKKDAGPLPESLIKVYFKTTNSIDDFLYEADLFTDQNRDYLPVVNRGKHLFTAEVALLDIEWHSDEIQQWRSDVERLRITSDTLSYWTENNLDMRVSCTSLSCRPPSRLGLDKLKQYVSAGITLGDLKARFTCTRCGKREARISVFR